MVCTKHIGNYREHFLSGTWFCHVTTCNCHSYSIRDFWISGMHAIDDRLDAESLHRGQEVVGLRPNRDGPEPLK